MKPETLVTTVGRHPEEYHGVVNPPIYRTSTILFPTLDAFENCESGMGINPLVYGRSGTPMTNNFESAIAELDGAEHGIVTTSGLSAIAVTLMGMLAAGDHLLVSDSVYGCMREFCEKELQRFGVEVTYYNPRMGADIESLMRKNTKMVYCESPGSLTFEVQDIPAIAKVAHAHGAVVALDNTWATPLFCRAKDLGVDISIHSCTKYIGGHSDLVLGMITCGSTHYRKLRHTFRHLGCNPGTEEMFLASRGLRSMATRLAQHQKTSIEMAKWLEARPEVAQVLHPALPSHTDHALWKRDFKGASGLFSILFKPGFSRANFAAMLDHMKLFGMGYSWGGYESLLLPFKPIRSISPHWKQEGFALRIHAGLEALDDLIADLDAGLARMNGKGVA